MTIPSSILVICLGNICRSPVGEFILRFYLKGSKRREITTINVDSAGLQAGNGRMSPNSAKYLITKHIKPDHFQAKKVTRELLDSSNLILVMENYMKQVLIDTYYGELNSNEKEMLLEKIQTFTEVTGDFGDIEDPYGESWKIYERVLGQIDKYAQKMVQQWENDSELS